MGCAFLAQGGRREDRCQNGPQGTRLRKPGAGMPGDESHAPAQEALRDLDIPREQWLSFLDSFSRQHMHWMATIEATTPEGTVAIVEERSFQGISVDHAGSSVCDSVLTCSKLSACVSQPATLPGAPAPAACPRPASTMCTWPPRSTSSACMPTGPAPPWTGAGPATWHASDSASPHNRRINHQDRDRGQNPPEA